MVSWTDNPDWRDPAPKGELCGRVADRFTPCPHPKPCPVHDDFVCENPEAQWIEDQREAVSE